MWLPVTSIRLWPYVLALLVASPVSGLGQSRNSPARRGKQQAATPQGKKMNEAQPRLSVEVKASEKNIELAYRLTNTLSEPIFVFDRLYDMAKEALAANWYYTDIRDGPAVVARQVWPLPRGLMHENPEVPYARRVLPGGRVDGMAVCPVPLQETTPYTAMGRPSPRQKPAPLTRLQFRLGWAVASELPSQPPVKIGAEELYLFDYYTAIGKQRLVESAPAAVNSSAKVSR